MRIVHRIGALWRALFRSARVDADLAEEMRFHVDRDAEQNIARGMSPTEAWRAARLSFGSVDAAHESSRDDRPGATLRQVGRDLRFGVRLLSKSPVFALSAIAIVALGIGSATAVFSVVYGVMLRPLPYGEPEQLVSIWLDRGNGRLFPSAADAAELRQLSGVFDDVAVVRSSTNLNLVIGGEPRRLLGARISPNLFAVLGVSPSLGRAFARDEGQPGHEHVVVLSDALWRGAFGADPSIIGRQIELQGALHTVVGVMSPEFQYPMSNVEAWTPAVLEPGELTRETTNNYRVVARLRTGVSIEQAQRDVARLATRLASTYKSNEQSSMTVSSMLDDAVREVRPTLRLLLAAVSFLLLIACVNLANLFGARATARSGEFAIRLALGASRPRLTAQAIAESVPVLALGGAIGVLLAGWAVRAVVAAAPPGLPRLESIALNVPVIAYSVAGLVLTGIATSIASAAQAWRSDFTTITKDANRSSTAGRGRAVMRRIGVAVQVAFALPLLVAASLLIRSAINVSGVDLGFRPDHVATWSFEVSRSRYATDQAVAGYYSRLLDAVRGVPGVSHAAIANRVPLAGGQTNAVLFESTESKDQQAEIDSRTVSSDYFATLGVRLLDGRVFSDHDDASSPPVAIVDDRVARTAWPREKALGKRLRGPDGRWATVVGVVRHVRAVSLESDARPQVYWSYRQWTQNRGAIAVRTEMDPRSLFAPVINAVRTVDREQALYDVRTMNDVIDLSQAQRRLTTSLMIGFGGLSLLLAAVGIYGVVAYGVTRRMREFGIRVALGATRADVTQLVTRQGTSMATVGALVGLALSLATSGLMSNLVFGVAPRDLLSVVTATIVLMFVVVVASYIPARRAAAVDPGLTLRAE